MLELSYRLKGLGRAKAVPNSAKTSHSFCGILFQVSLTLKLPKLRELMQGFHTLTGLKIVLFDAEYREVLACPETQGPFCRLLRSYPASRALCDASNVQSFRRCRKSGELTIYRCHAGLLEATAPIADHGVVRGYVMFGQITDQADHADFIAGLVERLRALGVEETQARAAVGGIRSVGAERIHAAAQIMEACVCYLLRYDLVAFRKGRLTQRIDDFIGDHLAEDLSPQRLCGEFHLSRSNLYRLFTDHVGDSVAADGARTAHAAGAPAAARIRPVDPADRRRMRLRRRSVLSPRLSPGARAVGQGLPGGRAVGGD